MKRLLAVVAVAMALVAGACGASGEDAEPDEPSESTSAPDAAADDGGFGDLGELCGDGDYTVAEDEAGRGTDALHIAVANDRGADIRPGLNKVLFDASTAFASWCNEQGGVGGLQIELIDMDAKVFEVESAMATACRDAFAMVGGGLAQDALLFSGKPESDFHSCGMIDIPGFSASPEKAGSNGQVQPMPNPGTATSMTWFEDFFELHPENESWYLLWTDIPSLTTIRDWYIEAIDQLGDVEDVGNAPHPPAGVTDWTPYALQVVESGADTLGYVGEPENLADILTALRDQGWEGDLLLETNMYDEKLLAAGDAAEGATVRLAFHPIEEADEWPAVQQYLDLNAQHVPDGDVGALGMQSFSAWLLFVTAANACAERDDGRLTRACILEEAAAVQDWTGGGLHAPQDPEGARDLQVSGCMMLVQVRDGAFERVHPELDGDDDDGDGFSCGDSIAEVPTSEDRVKLDPDRPI
jgi:hypothetical protein